MFQRIIRVEFVPEVGRETKTTKVEQRFARVAMDYKRVREDNVMATFHLHKDKNAEFFWVLKSDENGKTVAMSSESYDSKQGAVHSIEWTRANAKPAVYKDHTV